MTTKLFSRASVRRLITPTLKTVWTIVAWRSWLAEPIPCTNPLALQFSSSPIWSPVAAPRMSTLPHAYQGSGAEAMLRALRGGKGLEEGVDPDGNPVFSAYTYSKQLNVGLVLKIDRKEVEWPLFVVLLIVLFT
eukprot:RCo001306